MRVAVVGLMPDFGHVAPLLRIARAAATAGHQVRCFVPEDARRLVEQFGLVAEYAPSPRPADADEVLRAVTAGGRWPRSVAAGELLKDRYLVPAHLAIHDALEQIARSIEAFGPDVLVADDLGEIRPTVRALAGGLGVPVLLHSAFGSRITAQSEAIRRWGPPERPWTRLAARLDRLLRIWRTRWLRLVDRERWREIRDRRLRLERAAERLAAGGDSTPPAELSFTTGLGILEPTRLDGAIRLDDERIYLGPVDPTRPASIPDDLARWLESSERPVVLLSFGTHLRPDRKEVGAIVQGIRGAGARCLWVTPDAPDAAEEAADAATEAEADAAPDVAEAEAAPEAADAADAAALRVESFLPQPTVLAHEAVAAFVTHGGAGGVQEALWCGVPLLCVPLQWDQHYNAAVVDGLGCGVRLSRGRVTARRVERAIRRLVGPGELRRRAEEVGGELREADGAGRVVQLIERTADR